MSNWTHKLKLKDLHSAFEAEELTAEKLGTEVATRVRTLIKQNTPPIPIDLIEEAEEIAWSFENDIGDVEDYDKVLGELYDWADTPLPCSPRTPFAQQPKLCWVNTF